MESSDCNQNISPFEVSFWTGILRIEIIGSLISKSNGVFKQNRCSQKLIPFLSKYRDSDGVVVALPRGGVPIGAIIAKALNLPLELLLVKNRSSRQ